MAERVILCVPTFKRPKMLARMLDAVARLETAHDLRVLVADNDAEGHAGYDLAQSRIPYRWPLTAVIAEKRGIAQVRNTLIEHALKTDADFIAMLDDDEWPDTHWLDAFLKTARDTNADVLQGSILFGMDTVGDGHSDIRRPTGPTDMLQGAGNILIRRAVLEETPAPWFDPAFGLTGGEDRDFFVRLQRAGRRFAWSDEARAHGDVPDTRAGSGWLLARAYSIGNSDMRVILKHRPGLARLAMELAKILAALLLSPPAAVILAASPNRKARALQTMFRAAGKLSAMFGRRYNEYAVVHGE
jgi:glycosyltransferase involved in cell wall biosynthesis